MAAAACEEEAMKKMRSTGLVLAALTLTVAALPARGRAHCDTLGGPVVSDARRAFEKGDVTPALKWVRRADERGIREAFRKALAVRGQGAAAKELAEGWFFETLVRVHREGEGAPYSGLKAAPAEGAALEADRALDAGDVIGLVSALNSRVAKEIQARFERAKATRRRSGDSVAAGRKAVAAYVEFVHYVENLDRAAAGGGAHAEHAAGASAGEVHGRARAAE